MPLPPRSVRVSGYHVRRSSASPSLVYVDDVRAEMALLPQSAPNASATTGVRLAQIVRRASPASSRPSTPRNDVREVPLAALIEAGGGRPPRAGTALGLGYDVVPRPEVLALDDKDASTDTPRVPLPLPLPTPGEARRASASRSPKRSPRLVPISPTPTAGTGTTPPLDSAGTSAASVSTAAGFGLGGFAGLAGSPRRFWAWGEPVTPRLDAADDEEWEYVDVEDGMVGGLELEVVKPAPAASAPVPAAAGPAYAEVVRQ